MRTRIDIASCAAGPRSPLTISRSAALNSSIAVNYNPRMRITSLAARGESRAWHRDGRGAPPARRDDREYREYLSEEQRRRRGCIARRMQPEFRHGLLSLAMTLIAPPGA